MPVPPRPPASSAMYKVRLRGRYQEPRGCDAESAFDGGAVGGRERYYHCVWQSKSLCTHEIAEQFESNLDFKCQVGIQLPPLTFEGRQ